ncbi:hypothetical protein METBISCDRAFT_30857 [Metschnikowia bicuspidata]|uniref:Uncharacterized protein n=1 Tax=Metschnikowia bicuspidata TaxID=27322 RepID=A0A4P9ZDN1_9ASCO|nr:hypothetical protein METBISCDRAFT_30857 [Metschnikowia bicuspidata]
MLHPKQHHERTKCRKSDQAGADLPSEGTDTSCDEQNLSAPHAKSKRSSSTYNDVLYERDRFRARFKTFNTVSAAYPEVEPPTPSTDVSVGPYSSQKTKKLNLRELSLDLEASCPTEAIVDLLSNYSIKEPISPLSAESSFFQRHLSLLVEDSAGLSLYSISAREVERVFHWYFNNPLPPANAMFPWLHGLHEDNYAQRSFFASQRFLRTFCNDAGASAGELGLLVPKPTDARFVMCIESAITQPEPARVLLNTVSIDQVLCRIQYSRDEVCSRVRTFVDSTGKTPLVAQITSDCFQSGFMPQFADLDPTRGVSLRNFHIQANKVARCADFVVYCQAPVAHEAQKCRCLAVARLFRVAQMLESRGGALPYNVFVAQGTDVKSEAYADISTLRDTSALLAVLDQAKRTQLLLPSMVAFTTNTFRAWDTDFLVKEKVEITRMSAASRLDRNVWVGNMWDYQMATSEAWDGGGVAASGDDADGAGGGGVEDVKEPGDNRFAYCDPHTSAVVVGAALHAGAPLVTLLPKPRAPWQLYILCHNEAQFPPATLTLHLLFKYTITSHRGTDFTETHHLDFPSSGSVGLGDCRQASLTAFVNTCKLLYLYASGTGPEALAALVYCSDGYTELSLFVLGYLMYAEDVSVEDAVLRLHSTYGRPFYLFSNDVQVLRTVEPFLRRRSPARADADIVWLQPECISIREFNDVLLSQRGVVPELRAIPPKLRLGYVANDSDSDSDSAADSGPDSDTACPAHTSTPVDQRWLDEFDGSFPSRILPYLYLGSLRHANCLTALAKLGISAVVSVGETVDWICGQRFQAAHAVTLEHTHDSDIQVYNIEPRNGATAAEKSASPACSVLRIMLVNNLQDDGLDELAHPLPRILAFIAAETARGGPSCKILVHCRVGVSRSASVVIAEVMRRYGMLLPQAYLYVRVRRLNIVIQPNLRFMYELFKWEELERMRRRDAGDLRVVDWFVMCEVIKKLNLPFSAT